MTPKPVTMWAVVVKSKRGCFIDMDTLRPKRVDTRDAIYRQYVGLFGATGAADVFQREMKQGSIRLARVVVAEEGGK